MKYIDTDSTTSVAVIPGHIYAISLLGVFDGASAAVQMSATEAGTKVSYKDTDGTTDLALTASGGREIRAAAEWLHFVISGGGGSMAIYATAAQESINGKPSKQVI